MFVWMTQSKLMQPDSSFLGVVRAAVTEQCHVLFGDWRPVQVGQGSGRTVVTGVLAGVVSNLLC